MGIPPIILFGGTGGIVENDAVEMTHADHHLNGVSDGAFSYYAPCREEA